MPKLERGEPVVASVDVKVELVPVDTGPLVESVSGYYRSLVNKGVPPNVAGQLTIAWQEVYWREMSAPRAILGPLPEYK